MKNGTLIVKAAICILLLLAGERLIAQKKPILEIDQPMPDFLLPEVQYYEKVNGLYWIFGTGIATHV